MISSEVYVDEIDDITQPEPIQKIAQGPAKNKGKSEKDFRVPWHYLQSIDSNSDQKRKCKNGEEGGPEETGIIGEEAKCYSPVMNAGNIKKVLNHRDVLVEHHIAAHQEFYRLVRQGNGEGDNNEGEPVFHS